MSLKNFKNILLLGKFFILRTNLFYKKRNFLNNYEIPLLIPKYWSNSNQKMNFKMITSQLKLSFTRLNNTKYNEYMSKRPYGSDKYLDNLKYSGIWQTMSKDQRENVQLISKVYNSNTYSFEQEGLFGEGFINGENPYALERIKYDPNNQFQKAILGSFCQNNKGQINTNGLDFGFDLSNLQSQISKQDPQIYVINFDHLRRLYQDRNQPIINDHRFEGVTYTHIPYALFLKANLNGKTRFVCLCAAFKYTKENQIKVLSPYLQNIPYQLWNIARMHTALPYFNDFSVRVHLGRMHFATSKFNAPLYNFYFQNKHNHSITDFYNHAYMTFNEGLEGVNLNSTAILVPPNQPLVQDVFIFRRPDALSLIANDLQAYFTFNTFYPKPMIEQNKLHNLVEKGSALWFNVRFYDILSEFINSLYKHYNISQYQKIILQSIRDQKKNVIPIQSLPLLLTNLAFTWVVAHSHTKNAMQFPSYYKFQPAILRKAIPLQPTILDLDQNEYLPTYMCQADQLLLSQTVSVQDKKNFLLDVFREKKRQSTDHAVKEIYHKIIKDLQALGNELKIVNEERIKDSKFKIDWLNPEIMQASLNV